MELREEGGNFFLIRPLPKSKAMVKAKEIFPLLPFSRRRGRKQKNRILPRLVPLGHGRVQSGEQLSREKSLPLFTLHAAKEFGHVKAEDVLFLLSNTYNFIIAFMWISALTPLWRRNPYSDQVFDPPIHEQRGLTWTHKSHAGASCDAKERKCQLSKQTDWE